MPIHPVARILRTILQVLAALVVVLPAVVAFLASVGVTVDGVGLAAVLAAAVVLVTTVQNALERADLIPTLGGPKLKVGEAVAGAPLYTHAEVVELARRHTEDDSQVNLLHALELHRAHAERLASVKVEER